MLALRSNNKINITNAVRQEVVSAVATLMMVHTMHPTPEQYTSIAVSLVKEYPVLKDSFGCGYVSVHKHILYTCIILIS